MRRFQIPNAALVAGLAVLLSGCSGETPTAPSSNGGNSNGSGGGNGSCTALVSISAPTTTPSVGSTALVRATVTRSGVPVLEGASVQFTTDLGVFVETGLPTASKTIASGVADVFVFSQNAGTAHVKAVFDCANAPINLNFGGVPTTGPFISSLSPLTGSCVGGDTVTIQGGRFGTTATNVTVTFGGVKGSITGNVTDTQLTVTTPAHPLKDASVPETVNVVVTVNGLASPSFPFTYTCSPRIFISSINPTEGASAGGDTVLINGGNFGTTIATTRVTFCGRSATITKQEDQQITVLTPASPAALEVCDVVVTRDLGLVSQQSATSPQQFTYRLVLTPHIFSVSPRTGPNDASTRVSIFGTGFQFPMQVFLTGGACAAQLVEAAVSDITSTTIVFKTPIAAGGNVCLANQLVDIVIKNPSTNQGDKCLACFKYYACPTITSIGPGFGPYTGGTQVIITGHNFEEPATVSGGGTAWQPISVSSEQIIAVTPPAFLTGTCADISSPVLVNGTSLSCPNAQGPIFTYFVKSLSPFVTNIAPASVPEAGAAGVVITGGNFFGNERVELKFSPPVKVIPTSETPTQIIFNAPQFVGTFNTVVCTTGGGVAGKMNVPTPVDLDILNATTTCPSATETITYIPADQSCK